MADLPVILMSIVLFVSKNRKKTRVAIPTKSIEDFTCFVELATNGAAKTKTQICRDFPNHSAFPAVEVARRFL